MYFIRKLYSLYILYIFSNCRREVHLTFGGNHSVVIGQVGGIVLVELLQILELLHDHLQVLGIPHIAEQVAQVLQLLGWQLVIAAALLHQLLEDVLECGGGIGGGIACRRS